MSSESTGPEEGQSQYLVEGRERVHAIARIGYPLGDDPEVATFVVASNNVTGALAREVFLEACNRYGVDEDDLQDAQDELADRVFPVEDPQYRTVITLGTITVEPDGFQVDWRTLSWAGARSQRGETA